MKPDGATDCKGAVVTRERMSRGKRITLWVIAVGIIVPAGYGFVDKFVQFVRTLDSEQGGHFTIIPIANYLLVTAGFVCLLIWAVTRGMFRDIEGPKYTMLEREAELDRREGHDWSE